MTDEHIETAIEEIDEELGYVAKLHPAPWCAMYTNMSLDFRSDPLGNTAQVVGHQKSPGSSQAFQIAGGTIHNTQREIFFMAEMRESYPEVLSLYRSALISMRGLRKKLARKARR